MATYHVGCGLAGIYAGTMKKNGQEWINKNCVTDEAIRSVATYMFDEMKDKKIDLSKMYCYTWNIKDGNKTLRLTLGVNVAEVE